MRKSDLPTRDLIAKNNGRVQQWICQSFHHITGPFRDEEGLYERCLDCGRRIPWDASSRPRQQPRRGQAA